jgi:23S rRNA pseudouridine2604 synthase
MEAGVDIGDYVTKPCKVEVLGEKKFEITLTEGKKHQIRRMVSALGNDVDNLARSQIMNIGLAGIKPGAFRAILGDELATFLKSLGL